MSPSYQIEFHNTPGTNHSSRLVSSPYVASLFALLEVAVAPTQLRTEERELDAGGLNRREV